MMKLIMVARAWDKATYTFKDVEESVSICMHITTNAWESEQNKQLQLPMAQQDRFHSDLTVSKIQH